MSDQINAETPANPEGSASPESMEGVEPPQRFPGGVDSIGDQEKYGSVPEEPVIPDLPTEDNPAIDDSVPEGLDEPDESQDEPSTDGASEPEKETQA